MCDKMTEREVDRLSQMISEKNERINEVNRLKEDYYRAFEDEESKRKKLERELAQLTEENEMAIQEVVRSNEMILEMEEKLVVSNSKVALLQTYINEIRPKADCYDRVCKVLGIEKDILGYIHELQKDHKEEKKKFLGLVQKELWQKKEDLKDEQVGNDEAAYLDGYIDALKWVLGDGE